MECLKGSRVLLAMMKIYRADGSLHLKFLVDADFWVIKDFKGNFLTHNSLIHALEERTVAYSNNTK